MDRAWRATVKGLGLEAQVVFLGQVPFTKVFEFYDKADLFVSPSVNDAFGSALLEVAARGLPILTLNHQGTYALLPASVAWKVPVDAVKRTIDGMAEAMVCMASDPDRLAAMSEAAIEYAHTESWPRRVEKISALYEEVLLERRERTKDDLALIVRPLSCR